jgi:Kdo2-lipid IVA lauroyltransferase/acyltransferase
MSRRFSKRSAYLATRVGLAAGCLAVKLLPRRWLYCLSDKLATLGFYLFRGFRTRSLRNASIALGEQLGGTRVHGIVHRSLRNFFRDFVEVGVALVVPGAELRSEIPVTGREHLDAALSRGNGIIVLSAHFGNFFLIGTRLALEGYPVHVLVNQPRNGQFAKLMDDYRLKVQQKTIHARPRREALREIGQVLRRNELAVMIADEHRRGGGIAVPFFSRTVSARRGPATLALRTGAAVVPAYLLRDCEHGLKLVIEPELQLMRKEKNKAEIRENTIRIAQWLERTVRAYPDQWNWMNIHWEDNAISSPIVKGQSAQRISY